MIELENKKPCKYIYLYLFYNFLEVKLNTNIFCSVFSFIFKHCTISPLFFIISSAHLKVSLLPSRREMFFFVSSFFPSGIQQFFSVETNLNHEILLDSKQTKMFNIPAITYFRKY